MSKLDKIILHIPLIGLMYMFVFMGITDERVTVPTYKETKLPAIIQIVSVVVLTIIMLITTY